MSAIYCGVDIGASATKVVLIDGDAAVLARAVRLSGVDYAATAQQCLAEVAALNDTQPITGSNSHRNAGIHSRVTKRYAE